MKIATKDFHGKMLHQTNGDGDLAIVHLEQVGQVLPQLPALVMLGVPMLVVGPWLGQRACLVSSQLPLRTVEESIRDGIASGGEAPVG